MTRLTHSKWFSLEQKQLDWLIRSGVSIPAIIHPRAILLAAGVKAHDGRFEETPSGAPWLLFEEPEDDIFWQPKTGELATSKGRAFALGQGAIDDPTTFAFDCNLNIFADPLAWLQAKRDGCVVLDWSRAFDRLRDCPRVAVAESLLFQFRRHMKPPRLPETFVIPDARRIAA